MWWIPWSWIPGTTRRWSFACASMNRIAPNYPNSASISSAWDKTPALSHPGFRPAYLSSNWGNGYASAATGCVEPVLLQLPFEHRSYGARLTGQGNFAGAGRAQPNHD